MSSLEITVQRKLGDAWPVVIEHTRPDGLAPTRREGELRLNPQADLLPFESEPLAYGQVLGAALFRDRLRESLISARSTDQEALHIRLFVEDRDLQALYWGRLCAPTDGDGWDFLALDQRAAYSLYLPSAAGRAFRPFGPGGLRALIVAACPEGLTEYGLESFDTGSAVHIVRQALGPVPSQVLARLPGAVGLPTLDDLCRTLTEVKPTLLHIVAHGQISGDETYLFFATPENKVERISATALLRELQRLTHLPHFVFLATCESAVPRAGLGGLAQRLVAGLGIPAAVAMTEPVSLDTAEVLAAQFYRHLVACGEPDLALVKACAGISRRPDMTVPVLYSRLGDRPLFSETEDRELTGEEMSAGLDCLADLLPRRAPVLLDRFTSLAPVLRATAPADRTYLSAEARERWDASFAELNALAEEVLGLSFRGLAVGKQPPPYDDRCPFPGLVAFGARFALTGRPEDDDRRFFFGRERLIEQLLARLRTHPFLAVVGGSGSGKSSLVLAGVVPALEEAAPGFSTIYLTPGNDPLAALGAALNRRAGASEPLPGPAVAPLLIVDQFEELFTLTHDEASRRDFVQQLLALTDRYRVVLTMRADFWGDCAPYPVLREAMLAHQVLIPPMSQAELRSAAEQQAAAVGLRFEADLSNTILDAVEGEPGAMPLLQHLLLELWQRRHGRWLRAGEYRAIGGIRRAIAHTADSLYIALTPEDQSRMRDIFLRLTARGDRAPALAGSQRGARVRVLEHELVPTGEDPTAFRGLIQKLAASRLIVTGRVPETGEREVAVAHEALIRHWPRLLDWLETTSRGLRTRESIREAAEEWQANGRDAGYIAHRDTRLKEAEAAIARAELTLNALETAYLAACRTAATLDAAREAANLARTGWGVIFPACSPDDSARCRELEAIREALAPLLAHRQAVAQGRYRIFQGEAGYRSGESAREFLRRHGVGSGDVPPEQMPGYLLIVGDPVAIPFTFQYQLSNQFAVGRIAFDSVEEYSNYAGSVVQAETGPAQPRRLAVFAPQHAGDRATQVVQDGLIQPVLEEFRRVAPPWAIEPLLVEEARKERLAALLATDPPPTFLFVSSHGMQLRSDDPRQRRNQGALLCQDWPGVGTAVSPDHLFGGDDIPAAADLRGMIAFIFAEYGAGTPATDEFRLLRVLGGSQQQNPFLAAHPFLAHLPGKLLSHPRGGALAVIAHVDLAWTTSFYGPLGEAEVISTTVTRILAGHPVGRAIERFIERYALITAELADDLPALFSAELQNDRNRFFEFQNRAIAATDTRNWIIIGDPAVRLKVE